MNDKKLFVGGYYDDRVFKGEEFKNKTLFDKHINTYTLEETLKLGFVEEMINWLLEDKDIIWDELTENQKIKAVLEYTEDDDMAGLLYFDTEEETEDYKQNVLKELKELEKRDLVYYCDKDSNGHNIHVLVTKHDYFVETLKEELENRDIEMASRIFDKYDEYISNNNDSKTKLLKAMKNRDFKKAIKVLEKI